MKLSIYAIVALACAAVSTSCDFQEQKVREFADRLGTHAAKNDLNWVRVIYPDAAAADSLALTYVPTQVTIEHTGPETYLITYGHGVQVLVEAGEGGLFSVKESNGLFAYSKDKLDKARQGNYWSDKLTDAKMSKVMAEKATEEKAAADKAAAEKAANEKAAQRAAARAEKAATAAVAVGYKAYSICYDGYVNVRSGPSTSYPIINRMYNGGDGATVLGASGDWYLVRYHGTTGYSKKTSLSLSQY